MDEQIKLVFQRDTTVEGHASNAQEVLVNIVTSIVSQNSEHLLEFLEEMRQKGVPPGPDFTDGSSVTYDDLRVMAHMGYAITSFQQYGIIMGLALSMMPKHMRTIAKHKAEMRFRDAGQNGVEAAISAMHETLAQADAMKQPN
jgi:hypothetical protein